MPADPVSAPSSDVTPVTISRLKRRGDFLRVAAERRKWVTPGLILQAAPTPVRGTPVRGDHPEASPDAGTAQPLARVGFTVSKKVGNSVQRNRARRRLREAVATLLPTLGQAGMDYVLIGRPATIDRDYAALLRDLKTALTRILTVAPGSDPLPPRGRGQGGKKGSARKPAAPAPHFGRGKGPLNADPVQQADPAPPGGSDSPSDDDDPA